MNQLTLEEVSELGVRIEAKGIFAGLQPEQIEELEKIGIYMDYCRELITADGHSQGYLFYVLHGDFEVSKIDPESQKKVVLAHISEGQCFGEMSLLTGAPASANVMALDRVICWAVPHDILRQFIETQPGGSMLAFQIAALLATRLREGNTRLMGINNTLSAYFGCRSRMNPRSSIEAPQGNEHAEVELPDELFLDFARETLGLPPDQTPTAEQLEEVRTKIELNEIDIVPWLEQGQKGRPLKVRLSFVPEDVEGTLPAAVADPATEPAKVPLISRVPQVVRVPQTRAQITPTVAYVPLPPNPFWRWTSVISWVLVLILVSVALISMTSLSKRESLAASPTYKSIPLQPIMDFVLFREQTERGAIKLDESTSYSDDISVPRAVRIDVSLDIPTPTNKVKAVQIRLYAGNEKQGDPLIEHEVSLPIGTTHIALMSNHLKPGVYRLVLKGEEIPHGEELQGTVNVTYVH